MNESTMSVERLAEAVTSGKAAFSAIHVWERSFRYELRQMDDGAGFVVSWYEHGPSTILASGPILARGSLYRGENLTKAIRVFLDHASSHWMVYGSAA